MYSARITLSHLNFVVTASVPSSILVHGSFTIVRLPHLIHLSQCGEQLFISVENDEPGIMKPGHCFTIEVHFELIVGLFCLTSRQANNHPRKEPSRMDFPWWMDCFHQGTCLLQIGWCGEMSIYIELCTECPSRAYGPHHGFGSWGSDRVSWIATSIRMEDEQFTRIDVWILLVHSRINFLIADRRYNERYRSGYTNVSKSQNASLTD